jgi:hypothetical protein
VSKAKEELTKLIQEQPEDSSREEIVRELAFHVMVQRGPCGLGGGPSHRGAHRRDYFSRCELRLATLTSTFS